MSAANFDNFRTSSDCYNRLNDKMRSGQKPTKNDFDACSRMHAAELQSRKDQAKNNVSIKSTQSCDKTREKANGIWGNK